MTEGRQVQVQVQVRSSRNKFIRKNKVEGLSFDFMVIYCPQQTKHYWMMNFSHNSKIIVICLCEIHMVDYYII